MTLKLVTTPKTKGQFYLFGQRESVTYAKATALQRSQDQKMSPPYDRKVTYMIFFAREGRSDQFSISGAAKEFKRAFIPKDVEKNFPQDLKCHPRKPFDISASYQCMTFIFHIAGNVAITRNYWRSEKPEIEVIKNIGKLMVTSDLRKIGVRVILPKVDNSINDYSSENLKRCSTYSIQQISDFFRSDPHGRTLDAPALPRPAQ